ncbi:MAG: hypothetical protein J5J06_17100 [Phycisphaerae bacterium]|nr:hypothetical protein [Phycisphaerae bacterium]
MAKQIVGPLERHLEKAVIGLAALVLLGCVVRYLIASPNQMDLGNGKPVSPGQVDDVLATKANEVRERLRQATPQSQIPQPLEVEFEQMLNPFPKLGLDDPLTLAAPLGPEIPIIDPPEVIIGGAKLVDVLKPPAPTCVQGRSWLREDRDGGVYTFARNWVTCTTVFDRRKQEDLQAQAYGNTRRDVFFGPIEMQRRAQRPDGSWSDDDWQTIPPEPAPGIERIRDVPKLTLEEDGRQIVVPVDDLTRYTQFREKLTDPRTQLDLLRPILYGIISGDVWRFAELIPRRELVQQDDEYLSPVQPSPRPVDRYDFGQEEEVAAPAEEKESEAPQVETLSQRLQDLENRLNKADTEEECIRIYNTLFDIAHNDASATRSEKNRAQDLMQRAEQKQRDLRRQRQRGGPGGPGPGQQPGEPGEKPREHLPRVQFWVIDSAEGSVEPEATYEYRVRVNLLNRLVGEPNKFDNPDMATVIFVPGPWTEPSSPVAVPPIHEFFVTGADARRKEVTAELFQWFEGYWVKTRERFEVGRPLARTTRAAIPDRFGGAGVDNALVQFDAHVALIDLEFDVPFRERSRGASREGATYPAGGKTDAAVLVDERGRLDIRFVAVDKIHPEKKRYTDMVWQPPRGAGP